MDKVRVVLVHNIVAPYRLPLFGTIARRVNLCVYFCRATDKDRKWSINNNLKFNNRLLSSCTIGPFVLNWGLYKVLRLDQPKAIILIDNEENIFTNIAVALYARVWHIPLIVWSGHIMANPPSIPPVDFKTGPGHIWPVKQSYLYVVGALNRWLYNQARSFLAYSSYTSEYLVNKKVDEPKIYVGTQAMDKTLLPVPTARRVTSKRLKLLYLGYLRAEKGVDVLIQAVKQLDAAKVELHIVGDGPEKSVLRTIAADKANIYFYDNVGSDERANWYVSADMMVLPTYFDPWGHVITEALHYGTPIICTTSAAASQAIKDGKNGMLFPAGDVEALRKLVDRLADDHSAVVAMRKYIEIHGDGRLYDVEADADVFMRAINAALNSHE